MPKIITKLMTKGLQKRSRIHRFNDHVALSFDDTDQLYLTPQDARKLANELKRFADNIEQDPGHPNSNRWVTTRIVQDGRAFTESTGKVKIEYI